MGYLGNFFKGLSWDMLFNPFKFNSHILSSFTSDKGSPVGEMLEQLGVDSSFSDILNSLLNKYAGTGLTGAEKEANAFTSSENQAARDWQYEMWQKTQSMQARVQDAQAAGINPVTAITGSAASVPSASNGGSSVSPSSGAGDLLSLVASIMQMKNTSMLKMAELSQRNAELKETSRWHDMQFEGITQNINESQTRQGEITARTQFYNTHADVLQKEYDLHKEKVAAEIASLDAKRLLDIANTAMVNQETRNKITTGELLGWQRNYMMIETKNRQAYLTATINLNRELADLYHENRQRVAYGNRVESHVLTYREKQIIANYEKTLRDIGLTDEQIKYMSGKAARETAQIVVSGVVGAASVATGGAVGMASAAARSGGFAGFNGFNPMSGLYDFTF